MLIVEYNLTDFYLFENCPKNLIDEISNNLLIRNAISGETIFNQGDVPKNLYIILVMMQIWVMTKLSII